MFKKAYNLHNLLIALAFLTCSPAFSQTAVLKIEPTTNEDLFYPLSDYLSILPDPTGTLTIDQISDPAYADRFKPEKNWFSSPVKTHWVRLTLISELHSDKQMLAYIQGSTVDFFQEEGNHQYSVRHTGLLTPLPERDQKNRFGHLPFTSVLIKQGALQTFYWRINTNNFPDISPHTNLEPSISSYEYVLGKSRNALFFFVAICSILFGMALYHIVVFIVTRDTVYLYFTIYSMAACLYIMYFKGYLLELVFPLNPGLHYTFAFAFTCTAFYIALLSYVRKYIGMKNNFPVWDRILLSLFSLVAVIVVIISFTDIKTPPFFLSAVLILPILLLEAFGFVLLKTKHPFAKNYIAAFTLLFLGTTANGIFSIAGIEQGIWDFGDLGILGLQVLLAGGLAIRINLLNKEKQAAQIELIKQLKENESLQKRETTDLEVKVSQRTSEIEQQNEKLTRLNLLKDKLFSIISHDIKGPLNQLSSTLYMMERDMITKEEIKLLVPQIRTNLSANTNFINELLTWAKSQLEGAKLNPQAANLQELIDSNFQLLKPIADAKGIQLTSHLSNPLSIYADVEMIKSVVRNLSANAIKFTNPRGIIQITVGVDKSFASISVQDNGKGISSENQKKLFGSQIFTTLGTANEKGTGIGLLLCKDFVEKNGGKIWVESEEGKGSKFAFTVPLNKN